MSEREGLYCKKHERWCPTGVCDYCAPVLPRAPIVLGGAHPVSMRGLNAVLPPPSWFWPEPSTKPMEPGELQRQMSALWAKMGERTTHPDLTAEQAAYGLGDCNHAAGYCKDTAHKYEKAVASLKRQLNVANQKMRENPIVLDLQLLTPVADPEE